MNPSSEQPTGPTDLGIAAGQIFYHFNPRPKTRNRRPIPKGQLDPFAQTGFYVVLALTAQTVTLAPIRCNSYSDLNTLGINATWLIPFTPTPQELEALIQNPHCHQQATLSSDSTYANWKLTIELESTSYTLTKWDGSMILAP
ncbi:hypothetical protein [Rothia nasimurium]|uniref:hypothetical protein n=1 Tax=Rothia nasimurium TaxID=85336 RepID=UPI001F354018|nr:hypothetical protein [Rothia nasimurium]